MSVLRPGTFFTCAALASTNVNALSDRMCQTGFQYTPVASIATWVQPFDASHSDKLTRLAVVVLNVCTSVTTSPPDAMRMQATTLSLWTSRPAHRG